MSIHSFGFGVTRDSRLISLLVSLRLSASNELQVSICLPSLLPLLADRPITDGSGMFVKGASTETAQSRKAKDSNFDNELSPERRLFVGVNSF